MFSLCTRFFEKRSDSTSWHLIKQTDDEEEAPPAPFDMDAAMKLYAEMANKEICEFMRARDRARKGHVR